MTADPLFTRSYYAATAAPLPPMAGALTGDGTADLVVIGAGFTGLATALRAAEQGMRVILLEAETPGHGASGRNGGQLIPGLRWDARTLLKDLGRDRGKALFDLSLEARDRVMARIAGHAIACDLKPGHATMAWNADHYADLAEEAECLSRDMGYDAITMVAPERGRDVVDSPLYHGGMIDHKGGHFHPLNYAIGMAHACVAAGVTIHPHSRVTGYSEDGDGVTVTTATGHVRAPRAVLAVDTGMAALDRRLGGFAMPIINYNIATVPLGEDRARSLIPQDMAIADTRFVLNYFRLSADHRLIFGGGEKYLPTPPRSIDAFVRKHLAAVFPQIADIPFEYAWGGPVGVSMNRLPHIGHSDGGRVWFAHGFSGHGALLTTLAGEAIADAMAGEARAYDLFASLPARAFPGGTLLRWPLHVAGMLFYALRDRL